MTHLLVCIEKPKNHKNTDEWNHWLPFLDDTKKIGLPTGGWKNPAENVWLFALDTDLHVLTEFLLLVKKAPYLECKYVAMDIEKDAEPKLYDA